MHLIRLIGNRSVRNLGLQGRVSQKSRWTEAHQFVEKLHPQFQDHVPLCNTAQTVNVSSSTIQNIIKRSWECGEISVCKGRGPESALAACDLQALRQHCIKREHESVNDVTAWAQQHLQKNTVSGHSLFCRSQMQLKALSRQDVCDVCDHVFVLWAPLSGHWLTLQHFPPVVKRSHMQYSA